MLALPCFNVAFDKHSLAAVVDSDNTLQYPRAVTGSEGAFREFVVEQQAGFHFRRLAYVVFAGRLGVEDVDVVHRVGIQAKTKSPERSAFRVLAPQIGLESRLHKREPTD